ncbi:hypothetical protein ECC02_012702 [Trypanosoma cruzi]|uniref:C2H2-type domain-containing protein n=1 Tax=Trypanosoma cruzi TaxID=5693 RepID=A0A7J6XJN3_TRYCR|nr:hypothetical protein ECC02_012702 [Trypanosoma cruzi]
MKRTIRHRQTARQGQKVTRVQLQGKQVRTPNLLPRQPRPLQQRHQPRRPRPPLRQRHQVLQLQRRQIRRPPAHRQVFAKSTAASAALRGCVPRCCLPHPRWRTPLWAEEVCAGCACQHSKPRGHVYVYCGPMYKVRVIMIIVFFALLASAALLCAPRCGSLYPSRRTHRGHTRMHAHWSPGWFFLFFKFLFLVAFKLLVCRAVCEFCNCTDSICFVVCALLLLLLSLCGDCG